MDTLSVDVQYRPVCFGWCIRENNLDDYLKAMKLTHTLWGGQYNPIIPIDNYNLASELIDFFNVDILYPVSEDNSVIEFINKFPHLKSSNHNATELFIKLKNIKEPAFLDILQAAHRLRLDLNKDNVLSKFELDSIYWKEEDPLSHVFSAMFGTLPSSDALDVEFSYSQLIFTTLKTNCFSLNPVSPVNPKLLDSYTINCLTQYALIKNVNRFGSKRGFYLGRINDFYDLVHFWNLKATGINLIFYDPEFNFRLSLLKEKYISFISDNPLDDYDINSGVGVWLKPENIELLNTKEYGDKVTVNQLSDALWNGLNIQPGGCYFKSKTVLGVLSKSNGSTLSFQLPTKPTADEDLGSYQQIIASVNVYGGTQNEEEIFSLPYIPKLNEIYARNSFMLNSVRIERGRIGFIIHHFDSNLSIKAISVRSLIEAIFEIQGMKTSLSDAGKKTSRLIKTLGTLQNCRVFKVKGVRELIKKHKPSDSFTKSTAIQIIGQNDSETGKPNFEKYKQLYMNGKKVNSESLFVYLAETGVFRVGLNLTCPNCILKFWCAIDNLKTDTRCDYCGVNFEIVSQLKDRDWAYRRSGIFGLDDNQAGGIPVALTLQQLHLSMHLDNFLYSTSINIEPQNADINNCESDFVILTYDFKGKASIVISECKSKKEITSEDVKNLMKVADALTNKYIEVYILFSKLTEFSDEEIKLCRQAQEKHRKRVIMLTDRELEQGIFMYEETKKRFQVENCRDWGTMALNTNNIYFETSLKKNEYH